MEPRTFARVKSSEYGRTSKSETNSDDVIRFGVAYAVESIAYNFFFVHLPIKH
jgi:hypothetical protein